MDNEYKFFDKEKCIELITTGLEGEELETTKELINKVDFHGFGDNAVIMAQLIPPILRHIVHLLFDKKDSYWKCFIENNEDNKISGKDLIPFISIHEIVDQLDLYCTEFMPLGVKHLKNMDSQGELALLFSENYYYGLLDKFNHERK